MFALFVLQIAETASQVQIAVDSTLRDGRPGLGDPVNLRLALRLVVYAHLDGHSVLAHDAARIAGIGNEYLIEVLID